MGRSAKSYTTADRDKRRRKVQKEYNESVRGRAIRKAYRVSHRDPISTPTVLENAPAPSAELLEWSTFELSLEEPSFRIGLRIPPTELAPYGDSPPYCAEDFACMSASAPYRNLAQLEYMVAGSLLARERAIEAQLRQDWSSLGSRICEESWTEACAARYAAAGALLEMIYEEAEDAEVDTVSPGPVGDSTCPIMAGKLKHVLLQPPITTLHTILRLYLFAFIALYIFTSLTTNGDVSTFYLWCHIVVSFLLPRMPRTKKETARHLASPKPARDQPEWMNQGFTPRSTRSGASFSPYTIVIPEVDLEDLYSKRLAEQEARQGAGDPEVVVLPGRALPEPDYCSMAPAGVGQVGAASRRFRQAEQPEGFQALASLKVESPGPLSAKDNSKRKKKAKKNEQREAARTLSQAPLRPRNLLRKGAKGSANTTPSLSVPIPVPSPVPSTSMQTSVEYLSDDRRRIHREVVDVAATSPVKRMRLMSHDDHTPLPTFNLNALDVGQHSHNAADDRYTMSFEDGAEGLSTPGPTPKKRAPKAADEAMRKWRDSHRDVFLEQLLWLDGRGLYRNIAKCSACGAHDPSFRCRECTNSGFLCQDCIVVAHYHNPYHWVEQWTGVLFKRCSLRSLGLRIQTGHLAGERCQVPLAAPAEFVVIHHNGVHQVALDFCGCRLHGNHSFPVQLLRSGLYPATTERPQTCATLECLDTFHAVSLHSKCSAYDFYAALEYLTDGSGVKPPNRYKAFLRMARQFRHLLMLKRGGRGHHPSGTSDVPPGALAIRCPACPRPDVNLPSNWQEAAPEDQCLYILYIAMDACFRLKRRLIGSDLRDPGLTTGWAYFVEWEPYRQFLKTITKQKEMSTCSGLAALDHANTKFSRGYAATGVGAGICARHEFVQPNGVGDLQRGERYGNMDYILASLLRHIHARLRKIFSYDISCQWSLALKERLLLLPPLVRLNIVLSLCRFVVPKMHINAHIIICRLLFDLRLVPGSGQLDGEGIERLWSSIAGLAASSKLSGHGARADLLDDHWAFWNWIKLVGLAQLLRRRLDNARAELQRQEASFAEFSAEQADRVPIWHQMDGLTEAEVREQMEEEEREQSKRGVPPLHAVGPSEFIAFSLELEEQQRRIKIQAELKRTQTTAEKIRLKPMRRKLSKGIARLRTLQATYTPSALLHLAKLSISSDTTSEDVPLLLPSDLPESMRGSDGCKSELVALEKRLRHAQCKDALVRLRSQLTIKSRLLIYKKRQSRHQGANTRARARIARNESKIKGHSDAYQAAWSALGVLEGSSHAWPQLRACDIRGMEEPDELSKREAQKRRDIERQARRREEMGELGVPIDESDDSGEEDDGVMDVDAARKKKQGTGESKRTISWIWTLAGNSGTDAALEDGLRMEWAKAYARVKRWREEVRILTEEWRRLPLSFAHEREQWIARKDAGADFASDPEIAEGMAAYAMKQASMYDQLIVRAERTRTEQWAGRGHRRGRNPQEVHAMEGVEGEVEETIPPTVAFVEADEEDEDESDDEDDSDEDDDELASDEELDSDDEL
ncbi:CxC2 domain-containing protein [Mycena kentingensis (nom. inval.)]|nr:CxC2 domain-containing protein [Mycena kentingensis (nom. inval.)]